MKRKKRNDEQSIGLRPMDRKDAQAWAAIAKTRLHVPKPSGEGNDVAAVGC